MGKFIVNNMMSLDGMYEGPGASMPALFTYTHPDYRGDDRFDHYAMERLSAADILLFGSGAYFRSNQEFWTALLDDATATDIRREIARRMRDMPKVAVSDRLSEADLARWTNTRVVRISDAAAEIAVMRASVKGDILLMAGRTLWNSLLPSGLVDELHLTITPAIASGGTPIFTGQPGVSLRLLDVRTWEGSGNVMLRYGVTAGIP